MRGVVLINVEGRCTEDDRNHASANNSCRRRPQTWPRLVDNNRTSRIVSPCSGPVQMQGGFSQQWLFAAASDMHGAILAKKTRGWDALGPSFSSASINCILDT